MTPKQIAAVQNDEAAAFRLFESIIWPNGPVCPRCDNPENKPQYDLGKTRVGLRKCGACRKQYTARIGTIFEDSHIPLGSWLVALHRMCASKKGISASQLERELGLTYKSAWFMCHRIRAAMAHPPLAAQLGGPGTSGVVEVDETYVGGKAKNNIRTKGHVQKPKAIVLTLVERDGPVRAFPIPATSKSLMQWPIRQNVEGTAHIVTDKHVSYRGLDQYFASHGSVDHGKEYVRGVLHINFAESYHSLLKRGIVGTFHHVSEAHLPKYLSEFSFRWNTRKDNDATRMDRATAAVKGVRMTYRALKATKPKA